MADQVILRSSLPSSPPRKASPALVPESAADRAFTWASRLIGYLLYGGALLRAVLLYAGTPDLGLVLILLGIYLGLYLSLEGVARRLAWYPSIYLVLQAAVVTALLAWPDFQDFFAILFAALGAQAVQHFRPRLALLWLALFVALTLYPVLLHFDLTRGLAAVGVYTAIGAFVAWYTLTCERAQAARARNQELLRELGQANGQLQAYAARVAQVAVERERSRLARELHDAVTQTIFSLTLTAKTALLLLERDPARVTPQLDHLQELVAGALSEMRSLVAHLGPATLAEEGLPAALRRHCAARLLQDRLQVSLEVQADGPLLPAEAENLFRIVQEALNNVVKHAQTGQASVHLRLAAPYWVEVCDGGRGFAAEPQPDGGHFGFGLMRERAEAIGWTLSIHSAPGAGTRVRVDGPAQEVL